MTVEVENQPGLESYRLRLQNNQVDISPDSNTAYWIGASFNKFWDCIADFLSCSLCGQCGLQYWVFSNKFGSYCAWRNQSVHGLDPLVHHAHCIYHTIYHTLWKMLVIEIYLSSMVPDRHRFLHNHITSGQISHTDYKAIHQLPSRVWIIHTQPVVWWTIQLSQVHQQLLVAVD